MGFACCIGHLVIHERPAWTTTYMDNRRSFSKVRWELYQHNWGIEMLQINFCEYRTCSTWSVAEFALIVIHKIASSSHVCWHMPATSTLDSTYFIFSFCYGILELCDAMENPRSVKYSQSKCFNCCWSSAQFYIYMRHVLWLLCRENLEQKRVKTAWPLF